MFDFMKNSMDVLYAQRGVYKEGTSPNEYDRNVWHYDPVNMATLAINPSVVSPTISYLFGEIKRGVDGNYYIPNMGRAVDKVHSYNGGSWNSNLSISDTLYKLSSSLPTQVYKIFDPSQAIDSYVRNIGNMDYELKDHLGNVRVVISDAKNITDQDASATITSSDLFTPEVLNSTDYYAFGMEMPGRKYQSSEAYRYGFNGKEKDNEVKGEGNSLDFGSRIHDPRLGRFLSVDPKVNSYPFMSPYCFAANNPIRLTDEDGEGPGDPLRLIFYGGAKKGGDNSAFEFAAKNVAGDYGGFSKDNMIGIKTAREIVTKINSQSASSIQSVDIFTHGGTNSLYTNDGSGMIAGNTSLYRSSWAQLFKGGATFNKGSAVIDEIDFNKFTNSAKIELHGCNTCDKESADDNIAADFSTRLFKAGKERAVVIGHTTPANPNIDGDNTTNSGQDYRHGERSVYHNGEILFTTKEKGRISGKTINSYLDKKAAASKNGDTYDGASEVYSKNKIKTKN